MYSGEETIPHFVTLKKWGAHRGPGWPQVTESFVSTYVPGRPTESNRNGAIPLQAKAINTKTMFQDFHKHFGHHLSPNPTVGVLTVELSFLFPECPFMVKSSTSSFLDPNWFAQNSLFHRWEEVQIWERGPVHRANSTQHPTTPTAGFPSLGLRQSLATCYREPPSRETPQDIFSVSPALFTHPHKAFGIGAPSATVPYMLSLSRGPAPMSLPQHSLSSHLTPVPSCMSLLPGSPPDLLRLCVPMAPGPTPSTECETTLRMEITYCIPHLDHQPHEGRGWICLLCHEISSSWHHFGCE